MNNAISCAKMTASSTDAQHNAAAGRPLSARYDVLIVGGGNTRHTRNMGCAHDSATETLTGPYSEEEFWKDLLAVTGGQTVLAVHLAVVLALFLSMPYGKFIHGLYRVAALAKYASERRVGRLLDQTG